MWWLSCVRFFLSACACAGLEQAGLTFYHLNKLQDVYHSQESSVVEVSYIILLYCMWYRYLSCPRGQRLLKLATNNAVGGLLVMVRNFVSELACLLCSFRPHSCMCLAFGPLTSP